MSTKRFNSRFRVIEINESQYWKDDIVAKAGKIFQVYLYDANVAVNMAEITPSYRLIPLYVNTEIRVDDDTDELILREIAEDTYAHCRSVDAMKSMSLNRYGLNIKFRNSESGHYNEAVERAVEYLQGNHPI